MITFTLPAVRPYDFAPQLRFLSGFRPTAGQQRVDGGTLTRALRAGGRTFAVRLAADGEGLRCDLPSDGPAPSDDEITEVRRQITSWLSLDDDLHDFYEIGRRDPGFAPVIDRLYGYHQVRFPTPLENAVWAILSQRTALPVAAKEKQALSTAFDNVVTMDDVQYRAFPDVEQLASLPPGRIAELVGNARKGQYLAGTVRAWLDLDEDHLRTAPFEEAKDILLGLPGIGPWSATFILIRGFGRTDEVPAEKQLVTAASRAYGRSLTPADVRKLGEPYGPWAGYWAHYLRVAA
ncbi:DNA-3-methyladenine glycosylase family protein [Actinomadura harenae]|uniref:DNA-3-methyladenine glycosylase II n=1 Tax=Actinomadura harenae TaxID=2483351 RepID=A0A3M2MDB2_9ACTN|nr:DNA-3-methyladenine glycosylase [Actinomadura harenae]RMI47704.1 DNA-3-methyladenine glycosylase 2 family protein [Actinomadura harenae]